MVEPPQPKKKKKKKKKKSEYLDPFMHDVMQRSLLFTRGDRPVAATPTMPAGQQHLLYRATPKSSSSTSNSKYQTMPTRLVVRRRTVRGNEEGMSGTHIYAVRLPPEEPLKPAAVEQYPLSESAVVPMRSPMLDAPSMSSSTSSPPPPALKEMLSDASGSVDHLFTRTAMLLPPQQKGATLCLLSVHHVKSNTFGSRGLGHHFCGTSNLLRRCRLDTGGLRSFGSYHRNGMSRILCRLYLCQADSGLSRIPRPGACLSRTRAHGRERHCRIFIK